MRIVAGKWRGRLIKAPPGRHVRPTRDRVREAWMSILQPHLPGARIADLFAGSGALGLEALSRGADSAHFVDTDAHSLAVLRDNLTTLEADERSFVITRVDAEKFITNLPERSFDIVFADPPYATGAAVHLAEHWLRVPYTTILSIEHASTTSMPPGGDTRRYGTSSITFYRAE